MALEARPGRGGLPMLAVASDDGARAEIYLHGAHVTSWIPAGEHEDRLFLSDRSRFVANAAIRGGMPVCFPQFADQGPLQPHGFARDLPWRVVADDDAPPGTARLRLDASPQTRASWPHDFRLDLVVSMAARRLAVQLEITNTGESAFSFTGALHTYLRLHDVAQVRVHGLQEARYRDKVTQEHDVVQRAAALAIDGEIDRVYAAAPEPLRVDEPTRSLAIRTLGFPDTVVWNPGPARASTMDDMEPGGERRMLCVEAAAARAPVEIAPGARWIGAQILLAG